MIISKNKDGLCKNCIMFTPHEINVQKIIENNSNFKNNDIRLKIMIYQVGEMNKFYNIYAHSFGAYNEEIKKAYIEESKICLMNLLIQIDMFCINQGWHMDTLRHNGYLHIIDKSEELAASGGVMI